VITEDEIRYYKQLDERQGHLFPGMKAKLLGRSGVCPVSEAFGVDARTVRKGKSELSELPDTPSKRIRKVGGGAKKTKFASQMAYRFRQNCGRKYCRATPG
jgi:hypothetical protein